jgi:hypothetical protein
VDPDCLHVWETFLPREAHLAQQGICSTAHRVPTMIISLLFALLAVVHAAQVELQASQEWQAIADTAGLEVNFCSDLSDEKALCRVWFGEFCTYCRRNDGNICVTKQGVKRAEAGAPSAVFDCAHV